MDYSVNKLTKALKGYDSKLYAHRIESGMIQIYREGERGANWDLIPEHLLPKKPNPIFILALTDDWSLRGCPVEWGVEPVMAKLQAMDNWRDDQIYDRYSKEREKLLEMKEREKKNNIRAVAADLRSEFAKATNDIVVQKE